MVISNFSSDWANFVVNLLVTIKLQLWKTKNIFFKYFNGNKEIIIIYKVYYAINKIFLIVLRFERYCREVNLGEVSLVGIRKLTNSLSRVFYETAVLQILVNLVEICVSRYFPGNFLKSFKTNFFFTEHLQVTATGNCRKQ